MKFTIIAFLCLAIGSCFPAEVIFSKEKVIVSTVEMPRTSEQNLSQNRPYPRRGQDYFPFLGILKSASGEDLVVDMGDKYWAVSLDARFVIREITGQDFQKAERSRAKGYDNPSANELEKVGIQVSGNKIQYKGKTFKVAGKGFPSIFLSQQATRIAVISYRYERRSFFPPLHGGGSGPEVVKEHLDVYDVSSGESLLPKRIERSNPSKNGSLHSLVWLDDRYLIVPMENGHGLRTFLLAIFPKK